MLSAEAYGAEVGSATPSSMCSPPGSEIGDCSQANLYRVARTRPFFFCQQAINLQGFIKENLLTRCSIPRRRTQDCRTGPADSRSRRMSPRHRRGLLHPKGSHPRHRSTGPPPRHLPLIWLNHNHHYPILPRSSTSSPPPPSTTP